jgi:2Fe-2S ferredoxin
MPFIRFTKDLPALEVPEGTYLMEALLKAGLPVASSCHGDAVCGKCRVEVIAGWENLSAPEGAELIVNRRLRIKAPYRVSCQARVLGDVTVDTTYW